MHISDLGDIGMTQRRRSSKRNRNKSSPQTDSSPKKHRTNKEEKKTSVSIQESVEDSLQSEQSEHFDTAGVGINDPITSSVPSTPVTPVTPVTPTSEFSHPMSNGAMNNGEMANVSQQDNSGMDSFDPVAVPQMGPPPHSHILQCSIKWIQICHPHPHILQCSLKWIQICTGEVCRRTCRRICFSHQALCPSFHYRRLTS